MKLTVEKLKQLIVEQLEQEFEGELMVGNDGIRGRLGLAGQQLYPVNISVNEIPRTELEDVMRLDKYAIARTLLAYFGNKNVGHPLSSDYTNFGRGVHTLKMVNIKKLSK